MMSPISWQSKRIATMALPPLPVPCATSARGRHGCRSGVCGHGLLAAWMRGNLRVWLGRGHALAVGARSGWSVPARSLSVALSDRVAGRDLPYSR
jgi:O-antigen ligase